MSLFAILYTADELTPEQVMATLFPEGAAPSELQVRASVVKPKNYILETTGVAARVEVYFQLDKERAGAARRALGAAARAFLGSTAGDVILMYNDTPVIRRKGDTREYAREYPGLEIPDWTPVETIRIPRDD